jgi:GNAT superfamily N-acetyltransferase
MAPLTFRVATSADVASIVRLVESAYRGDTGREGWTTESDLLDGQRTDAEQVGGLIVRADSQVLLAERELSLVACAHLEKQGDAGYFGMFSVSPREQRGGVGKGVLAEAERIAAAWGCGEMRMTVIDIRSELVAWYERRGYHRTGRFEPFPYGDARFGIPRRADLRFEVLVKKLP